MPWPAGARWRPSGRRARRAWSPGGRRISLASSSARRFTGPIASRWRSRLNRWASMPAASVGTATASSASLAAQLFGLHLGRLADVLGHLLQAARGRRPRRGPTGLARSSRASDAAGLGGAQAARSASARSCLGGGQGVGGLGAAGLGGRHSSSSSDQPCGSPGSTARRWAASRAACGLGAVGVQAGHALGRGACAARPSRRARGSGSPGGAAGRRARGSPVS